MSNIIGKLVEVAVNNHTLHGIVREKFRGMSGADFYLVESANVSFRKGKDTLVELTGEIMPVVPNDIRKMWRDVDWDTTS